MSRTIQPALPLERRHMPTDFSVSLERYTKLGAPRKERIPGDLRPEQLINGLEAAYRKIIDCIARITCRIWEERFVEYIGDT